MSGSQCIVRKTDSSLESEKLMAGTEENRSNAFSKIIDENEWPGIDSRYRLIVVAALRSKQLLHGARPRIEADVRRHRNTSIALEEVRQGLVPFTINDEQQVKSSGDGLKPEKL
jgi:DNA-directed RNA polymerase omega subunit